MQILKKLTNKYSAYPVVFQVAFIVFILGFSFLVLPQKATTQEPKEEKKSQVLGVETPDPTPTESPTPTVTSAPKLAIKTTVVPTNTPTLTPTPTAVSGQASTPTPTPQSSSNNTSTPTPTPTDTPTPTPTTSQNLRVVVDYQGQHENSSYEIAVNPGTKAWDAIVAAVGIGNLQYTDYGGDLGIFITGFNGVNAAGNQYYEFRINGSSASVGVSTYVVSSGDVLEFVLTTF